MKAKSKRRWAPVKESPDAQSSELIAEILARLNGLIFLLADSVPRPTSDTEARPGKKGKKVRPLGKQEELSIRLAQAGLRPIEIAAFTGRVANNISRDLSKARKQGRLPPA